MTWLLFDYEDLSSDLQPGTVVCVYNSRVGELETVGPLGSLANHPMNSRFNEKSCYLKLWSREQSRKKPDVDVWMTHTCTHMCTHTHTHNKNNKAVAHTACIRLLAWMDTDLGIVWGDMVSLGALRLSEQDLPVDSAAGGMEELFGHPPGLLGGH